MEDYIYNFFLKNSKIGLKSKVNKRLFRVTGRHSQTSKLKL